MTKGTICAAIADDGLTTVGQVKAATKAGTGCGSCVPLCTAILHHELEKAGVTIDRSLCEHFPFTRQQLFDIVRVRQVRTFERADLGLGQGPRLRDLPAGGGVDAGVAVERVRPRPGPRRPAGHQRPVPGQHAEGRELLDHPPGPRRRDLARQAHRPRRGGAGVQPLLQDHRRPAHRPVRRPPRPAARTSGPGSSTPGSKAGMPTGRLSER